MAEYKTMDERRAQQMEAGNLVDQAEYAWMETGGDFENGLVADRQAWHGRARVHEGGIPLEVARKDPSINFDVEKHPMYSLVEGVGFLEVENRFATVRMDRNEVLGSVSDRYTVIQNKEGFDWLSSLCDSGDILLEAVISLRGGKVVCIEARRPDEILLAGEKAIPYLAFINSHDGSWPAMLISTPERTVCMNTVKAAKMAAAGVYKVRHIGEAGMRLQEARAALGVSFAYTDALKEMADELVLEKVSDKEFDDFLKSLVEVPEPEYSTTKDGKLYVSNQTTINNRQEERSDLRFHYMTSDNLGNIRRTKWGVYNAVTEFEQHVKTWKDADRRAEKLLTGGDLGQKALALLTT
jgi:phage/plasmid-like protein (TIGR03299 family)